MDKHLFIIGPGGAGKSTCGQILARNLKIPFMDLDSEFMNRVGSIQPYIKTQGYEKYCQENSNLFYKILNQVNTPIVFILSSGFLTYEIDNLKEKNLSAIKNSGQSILLMPSKDPAICAKIIIERQLNRGFGLNKDSERKKIRERFDIYKDLGDVQIFSAKPPKTIVHLLQQKLKAASKPNDDLV